MKLFIIFVSGYLFLLVRGFFQPLYFIVLYLWLTFLYPQAIMPEVTLFPFQTLSIILALGAGVMGLRSLPRTPPTLLIYALFFVWVNLTTSWAVVPAPALDKWAWVVRAMPLPMVMPLMIRDRVGVECAVASLCMGLVPHVLVAGLKTIFGGGGYRTLRLLLPSNIFLGETSALSMVAIMSIPLLHYLLFSSRASSRIPFKKPLFGAYVIVALAAVVGTAARTGLVVAVCAALVLTPGFWKRIAILGALSFGLTIGVNWLPSFWTERMSTISSFESESSASARLDVWRWTVDYSVAHPFGGGFDVYRINELREGGRAFHSMYFEVLGEQGLVGFGLFAILWLVLVVQLSRLKSKVDFQVGSDAWISKLAHALHVGVFCVLSGGAFIGIAYHAYVTIFFGLYWCIIQAVATKANNFRRDPLPIHV